MTNRRGAADPPTPPMAPLTRNKHALGAPGSSKVSISVSSAASPASHPAGAEVEARSRRTA